MLVDGPDCRLWVEARGNGPPVSVFAHGITSSSAEVAPFARRTPGTRVLFDFRGHGRSESPAPEAGYDHAAMARDLSFVAERAGARRAFGVSMGAGALLRLAAERPDRFERIGLLLPSLIDEPAAARPQFPALADLLESKPLEEVAEAELASPVHAPLLARRPWWRRLIRQRILRMNATGVPRALRAYAAGDPPLADADALRAVRAPVLVLAHEGDPVHPAAVARRLGELLPNATVRVWEEPLAMLDDVEAFARLVGGFLGA